METDRLRSNRVTVILDTNFILSCVEFGIGFDEIGNLIGKQHEIVVPSNVVSELENLDLTRKDAVLRKIALKIIVKYPILQLEGAVDSSLLKAAEEKKAVVCTNDKELRISLRERGISVIFIRKRAHLELDGIIF